MDDILTVIISLIGSAIISFFVAKYYGERWVETRRSRREHSIALKDGFFKPWLEKIGEYNDEYCKINAVYSKEMRKMVPLNPREPDNIRFYNEAMEHLNKYENFLKDWENLKQITLKLNEELTILFEEIRVFVIKEIDLPYWCPRYFGDYSGDKPDEYLCPDLFIRSIYDEVFWRIETHSKQYFGKGEVMPTIVADGKKIYYLRHADRELVSSANEELVKRAQQLISRFVEDAEYKERIKTFMNKKRGTYDKQLGKVKQNIGDIIESIELGNTIKGKCRFCKGM